MKRNPNIIIFGAGAVGGSVGGWIAPHYDSLYFFDIGKVAEAMRTCGITLYLGDDPKNRQTVPVKVIGDLSEVSSPDVIVVAVKNYSLDSVAQIISEKVGNRSTIVALQNGIENQSVLPRYFSKVIYGIVSYNAWIDEPGVIGYQKRGPLVLGALNPQLEPEMQSIAEIFKRGVETIVTPHLQDAAHSKMIINLTNSFTTLIGHKFQQISDPKLFQRILTNLTYEGIQIVKAAGYKECKLGGMPSWRTMSAAAKLPQFFTKRIFDRNVKKMVLSSMAQDILQRGGSDSELESLNGYFLRLADRQGLRVPYNRAVYALCRKNFGKPGFKPMDVKDVWAQINLIARP